MYARLSAGVALALSFLAISVLCSPVEARKPTTVAFSSNGCSGFREARFFSCCFAHDLTFWAGGNRSDRRHADLTLRRCLLDISGNRVIADVGYFLLLLWSVAGNVIDDGWARAWRGTDHHRYGVLTPEEQQIVATERRRVCEALRINPKNGRYRVDDSTEPWREIWPAEARQICGGAPPERGAIGSSR